jgi:type III pantothenate kinase
VAIEAEAILARMRVVRPGKDLPVAMETEYRVAGQLGVDRLLGAYAAMKLVGAPVVTCSAGTCVTMEAVDKRGVLVGGAITPGLRAMMAGVKAAAPHLPVPEELPLAGLGGDVVGKTTEENLSVGIWLSLGAMLDRLAELGRYAVGMGAPVVMTGGDAAAAVRYCRAVTRIVPDLAMDGAARALEAWVEDEQL